MRNNESRMSYADYMEERIITSALYMIATRSTIRETADAMRVGKTTTHRDVTDRLERINPTLASQVREVLDHNTEARGPRGGRARALQILREQREQREQQEQQEEETSLCRM